MPPPYVDYDSSLLAPSNDADDSGTHEEFDVDNTARENSSIDKEESQSSKKGVTVAPIVPSYEGYLFTVLDPVRPGETVSWVRTRRSRMPIASEELRDKAIAYWKLSGLGVSDQFQALGPNQRAIVRRSIDEQNAAEKDQDAVWKLFGVRRIYKEHKTALKTWRINNAILVTLRRSAITNNQADVIDLSEPVVKKDLAPQTSPEKLDMGDTSGDARSEAAMTNSTYDSMSNRNGDDFQEQGRAYGVDPSGDMLSPEKAQPPHEAGYDIFSPFDTSGAHLDISDALPKDAFSAPSLRDHHRYGNVPEEEAELDHPRTMTWKCEHRGCGKIFSDRREQCSYHPGVPVFHEGWKGYRCCKPRVLTFDEFLTITPCTVGYHATWVDTSGEERRQHRSVKPGLVLSARSRSSSAHSSASSTLSRTSLAFSQFSVASSMTSLGSITSIAQYSILINDITKALICTKELEPILAGAFKDSEIGAGRLQTNVRRMIQHLGKDLKLEVEDKIQLDTARALKSPKLSSHAAQLVLQHMEVATTKAEVEEPTWIDSDNDHRADSGGDSSEELDEDDEKELSATEYRDIHDFLINSKAYDTFKEDLFIFVHKPYQRRVLSAFGGGLVGSNGESLDQDAISCVTREISWVPTRLLAFSYDTSLSYSDGIKAFVEDHMGETWNWWPLAPRLRHLRAGYFRLSWKSPCGIARHIDVPLSTKTAVQQALGTAPAFLDVEVPQSIRSRTTTGSGNAQSGKGSNTSPPLQSGSGGANSATTLSGPPSQSQQVSKPEPIATPGHQISSQKTQQPQLSQHLSLCVVSSSRRFVSLRCDHLRSDLQFFARLKAEYDKARGWPRLWFSMWQYKYSEFVLFHKYGVRRGARLDIGFPSATDQMYHFLPRKPRPPPPKGPISREQFQDHYYLNHCPSLYDWRRYQLSYRGHFNKVNRVALDAVPKRLVQINMDDGVDEHFFGLYAKEERSFAHVAVYAGVCNLPGVVFFFLWLFRWGHGADLQNASVPLTLSLSLTLGFAAVVFGTRDGA